MRWMRWMIVNEQMIVGWRWGLCDSDDEDQICNSDDEDQICDTNDG